MGSTQLPLQSIGAADGHPDTHEYVPPEPAHTLVVPVHALPQVPQLAAVVYWTHAPPQRLYPALHAIEQTPSAQVGWAFATAVLHAVLQFPHVDTVVRSTQTSPQADRPAGQPPSADTKVASSPESEPPSPARPPSGTPSSGLGEESDARPASPELLS